MARVEYLKSFKIKIVRFLNTDVLKNIKGVVSRINDFLAESK